MLISDWSSDVGSADLPSRPVALRQLAEGLHRDRLHGRQHVLHAVVQLVGQRLQRASRIEQLGLSLDVRGDVDRGAEIPAEPPVGEEVWSAIVTDPAIYPVKAPQAVVEREGLT